MINLKFTKEGLEITRFIPTLIRELARAGDDSYGEFESSSLAGQLKGGQDGKN